MHHLSFKKLNLESSPITLWRLNSILFMQSVKDCSCTIAGRSAICGADHTTMDKLYSMEVEQKSEPRVFSKPTEGLCQMETEFKSKPRLFCNPTVSEEPDDMSTDDDGPYGRYLPTDLRVQKKHAISKMRRGLIDDTSMMEKNRNSLNKFESLSIQGQTLTGISIGGYDIDISKAAEKTMEIIPLPASKLPIIFKDETLNFYHHFFQGMVMKIGQSRTDIIVRSEHHYDEDEPILMPIIEDMIASGFERSDTESVVLIKKVLSSTFEPTEYRQKSETGPRLKVVANLWGFQYIECGMQMAEVDLRMWFSICHSHYRTIWFNTFKTTGIPSFASQGVRKSRSSTSSSSNMPPLLEIEGEKDFDNRSMTSRTGRRRRTSGKSVKSSNQSPESASSYQVTRWLGGRT